MIRLTDEEITELWKQLNKQYPKLDRITSIREGAKAQLKKMVEWGEGNCLDHPFRGGIVQLQRKECTLCWQALLEETK